MSTAQCAQRQSGWTLFCWTVRSLFTIQWWENRARHLVSEKWCGNEMVPLDHRTLYFDNHGCEMVASFLNDSFEIGIGYPNKWHTIIRRESIHKLIRWYLRQFIFGEWCGLRRWAFYKLLHRSVERHRRHIRPIE